MYIQNFKFQVSVHFRDGATLIFLQSFSKKDESWSQALCNIRRTKKKKKTTKRIPEKHLLLFHLKPLITRNCRKFLKRWEHQTTLLPPEKYAGQEATVRIGHGTTDRLKIGKEIHQGYILSPCLFNSYAGCVTQNASLDETEAGIKITGGNNNLRYADGTTLMAESQ